MRFSVHSPMAPTENSDPGKNTPSVQAYMSLIDLGIFLTVYALISDGLDIGKFGNIFIRLMDSNGRMLFEGSILTLLLLAKSILPTRNGLMTTLGLSRWDGWCQTVFIIYGKDLSLTIISLLLCLGMVEAGLRLSLDLIPASFGNHLGSGYYDTGSGIYRYDSQLHLLRMRPNYRRAMFFNDYHWTHQTDGLGFRNPTTRTEASIVLLGDSMIYGHGVEESSTVRSHLEKELPQSVINLGQQGACIHTEYQILKNVGMDLHPQQIYNFILNNDLVDLREGLSEREMQTLLNLPTEDHSTPYSQSETSAKRVLLSEGDGI